MKCKETLFEGKGVRENPVGLSIYDGPMETVEYIWLNIWCMLDAVVPGRDELRENSDPLQC